MAKEIKNNIAAYGVIARSKATKHLVYQIALIAAALVLGFAMPAFATYTPPVGNNNDVQYKNGFGFAGSDNFVVDGTNIGIGTSQPFALFSIGTNNGTGVLGSPGGFQVDSKGSLTMYGDDGTVYFLGNVHTHEIGTDYSTFDDGDGNVNFAGVLNVNSSNNNISPEFAVNDFNDSIALQVNDDDSGRGDYVRTLNNVIDDGNGNVGIGTVHPNNSLIVAIGNVGIGTAFPGQKLDVQGTVRATNFVGNGSGLTGLSSGLWATQNTTDQSLAGGNVGIGTTITNAGAALSVMNGNVGIGTWVPAALTDLEDSSTSSNLTQEVLRVGRTEPDNNGNGREALLTFSDSRNQTLTGAIGGYRVDPNDDYMGGLVFLTTIPGDGGTASTISMLSESMRIAPGGNVGIGTTITGGGALTVMNGNVGIGTWVPGALLNVNNPAGGEVLRLSVPPNQSDIYQTFYTWTGLTGEIEVNNDVSNGGSMRFYTDNNTVLSEKMRITSTGNVGIGTLTPVGGLVVMNGNVGIGTWVPSSALAVEGQISTIASGAVANLTALTNGTNYPRGSFEIGNSTSDVNVGLYVSPSYSSNTLQIPALISVATDKTPSDSNELETLLYQTTTYALIGSLQEGGSGTNGTPLEFSTQTNVLTGSPPALYISNASTQNIGIGTTTPQGGLVVMNGNVGIGTWVPGAALQVAGSILSSSTSGIGYTKGAGSTVTQSTSKITGVTINAATGTITMNNAALAAAAIVTFTVTDSTVAATDCIFTQHDSGGTIGAYTITANSPAAGSFKISVRNNTAGSLSEAIVIRFAVIKAVTS